MTHVSGPGKQLKAPTPTSPLEAYASSRFGCHSINWVAVPTYYAFSPFPKPQPAPCFSCGPDTYQVICNALSADAPFSDKTSLLLQSSHSDASRSQRTQSAACLLPPPKPKEESQLLAAGQTLSRKQNHSNNQSLNLRFPSCAQGCSQCE